MIIENIPHDITDFVTALQRQEVAAKTIASYRSTCLAMLVVQACIHLMRQGWRCDRVDFVPEAIELAQARAAAADVMDSTHFYVAPVSQLDLLRSLYDLILDVGCLHSQPAEGVQIFGGASVFADPERAQLFHAAVEQMRAGFDQ